MKAISRCGAILLICCLLMALLPVSASADTYDIFTYEINSGEVTITGCAKNTTGKVVIPDTIEGYPVTAIGEKAFYQQGKITEVVLPDTVKTIHDYGFANCTSMTAIQLSAKLSQINYNAFYDCSSLTSVHFPASFTLMSPSAFSSCDSLSYLTVDDKNLHYYSIDNCVISTSSKTLILGTAKSKIPSDGSVTIIETMAFSGRSDLTHITIPHGVTKVRGSAFWACKNLLSIHLSDTVTNYVSQADVYGLSTLTVDPNNPVYHSSGNCIIETKTKTLVQGCKGSTIPADGSVTIIGMNAFIDARGLTAITIPEGVTTLNDSAFSECTGLSSISLPSTLETVKGNALYSTALTEVTFPSSVSYIGNKCTIYSRKLKSVTILNPYAQIDGAADTFYGDVTIYGYTGSTAEAYAKEYGKTFVSIGVLHTCTFDQKVSTDKYLSAPASCTAPAKYFYACTCGEKGTKTFTHGKALPHTYDDACDTSCNDCNASRTAPHSYTDAWKNDALVHWHECACGAKNGEAAHTWDSGAATDAGTVIYLCTICNAQRTESIVIPPEVTEPTTTPVQTEPTTPAPTEPTTLAPTESSTTSPAPAQPSTPEQKGPSLLWILPLVLVVLALLILIIFLLKRKKDQQKEA